MKKFILIIFFFSVITNLHAQPNPEWVQRYDNTSGASVNDMCLDKQGNALLVGRIGTDTQSLLIIKYSPGGIQEWSRTFEDYRNKESPYISIKSDDSGSVYIMAPGNMFVTSTQQTRICVMLLKYSSQGDLLWSRKYMNSDSLYTIPRALVVDDFSNIYVASDGYVEGQNSNYLTLKYNKDGNLLWYRFYDNPFHTYDFPVSIAKDKNNNIYLSGRTSTKPVVIKYNSLGDSLWVNMDSIMSAEKIIIDDELNMYFGATGFIPPATGTIKLAKYDSDRNLFWNRSYNNPSPNNNDAFSDFVIDDEGNSYITGLSQSNGQLGSDYVTIKYNSIGDSLWLRRFNPVNNSNDEPSSIAVDKQGNCIVTGKSNNFLLGYKYLTIVYTPLGQQKYLLSYNNNFPNGNHEATNIFTDSSGNFYITGNSQTTGGANGIATLKYSALTNVQQTSSVIPDNFELMQNYPNPFNPVTNIKFKISKNSYARIVIFNSLGKEIETIIDKKFDAGEYKVEWNADKYSSSVYYYSLFIEGKFSGSKAAILIK